MQAARAGPLWLVSSLCFQIIRAEIWEKRPTPALSPLSLLVTQRGQELVVFCRSKQTGKAAGETAALISGIQNIIPIMATFRLGHTFFLSYSENSSQ